MGIQSIYNKLAKYRKIQGESKTNTGTKLSQVQLAKIDEVTKKINMGYYEVSLAEETFKDGAPKIKESRDIMEFNMGEFEAGVEGFNEITSQLDELGIEYPDVVSDMETTIEAVKEKFDNNIKAFQDLGMTINAELRID